MAFFTKLWRGELGLGYTFWFFGVFMLFVLRIFEIGTGTISISAGQAGFLTSLGYFSLYSVVLWRAAANVEYDLIYARLARGFVLLGWFRYFISANILGGSA